MFSRRLHWDLKPNPQSKLLADRTAAGLPLLDLTVSNPTAVGLTVPGAALLPLAAAASLQYEPQPFGQPRARAAVASYYADRGESVPADRILLTASTSESYSYLFKLLADPGDEILVPVPSYPLFEFLAGLELLQVRPYPLICGQRWHPDLDALRHAVTPRTRAIVAVQPNNPTGSYLSAADLTAVAAICAQHRLALIVDEVFWDYQLAPAPRASSTRSGQCLCFTLSGLSKLLALPQTKLGWIVAGGPPELVHAALAHLELIADTYLSVNTPVQQALPSLLDHRRDLQARILSRCRANLAALTPLHPLPVEGGWSIILPVNGPDDEVALALLQSHGIVVQPGFLFDLSNEDCIVLSLITPPETLTAALPALANVARW